MKYGIDDELHVVVDAPSHDCELGDLLFKASLRGLERQFRGGLSIESHPTLFTDLKEAEVEAYARLVAARAAHVIARDGATVPLLDACRVVLVDAKGEPVFEAELPMTRF